MSGERANDPIGEDASTMKPSILDTICCTEVQDRFLCRKDDMKSPDAARFRKLLGKKECQDVICAIASGSHEFSVPFKKLIPKPGSSKKRTVYVFEEYEMMALRLLAQELYRYDGLFSDCLYSFRSGHGIKDAMVRLRHTKGIGRMYAYKTDIHNYFNSIDVGRLLPELKEELGDERLYSMLENILTDRRVLFENEVIEETKGVMAGTPISPFLANFYLRDVDERFSRENCIYMRYADDIIILADSEEELMRLRALLLDLVSEKGLEMNPKKEKYFLPGETIDFLGFSIDKNRIDLSAETVEKMKHRIKHSARSIRKRMVKKNAPVKGTIKALIREYNRKFFGTEETDELTWSRWYFSSITTDASLHIIDGCLQEWIRYVATGRHNKANHRAVTYDEMKECGYRTLVNAYRSSIGG